MIKTKHTFLNSINLAYLFAGLFFYSVLSFSTPAEKGIIYALNVCFFLSYGALMSYVQRRGEQFYDQANLTILVSSYVFFGIILINGLSYHLRGNFFVFSEADATTYHEWGVRFVTEGYQESLTSFLKEATFEDLGMILVLAGLYNFAQSNLIVNLLYFLISVLSAKKLFRIGTNFMDPKFAFLSSLSFSCASFMIWFHSSGLKESLLVYLVILLFDRYYTFRSTGRLYLIFPMILAIIAISFFRPIISGFFLFAVSLTYIIENRRNVKGFFFSIVAAVFVLIAFGSILSTFNRYASGGDLSYFLAIRESQGMIIGGVGFTYVVNILAQFFGPLTTFSPAKTEHLSIYAPGLLYRILLAVPFWIGITMALAKRNTKLYPLIFFVLIEMISLMAILEGLELRKSLIHIPFVFILAFYFLSSESFLKRTWMKQIAVVGVVVILSLLLIWNFRSGI